MKNTVNNSILEHTSAYRKWGGQGVLQAAGGKLVKGSFESLFTGVSTDTRTLCDGNLYIAITGQKFDGHSFLKEAEAKGAKGFIISEEKRNMLPENLKSEITVIAVENTLKALGDIARFVRVKSKASVIAVTGSAGKTTTKDLLSCVFSGKFKTLRSEGNFNNEIGLPLTLLKLTEEHETVIVEMGMRGLGEIEYLSCIARPDSAVITNIGMAHIERLGTVENIAKAKFEIINGMEKGKTVFLNGDDPILWSSRNFFESKGFRIIYCGTNSRNDIYCKNVKMHEEGSTFEVAGSSLPGFKIELKIPGIHNVRNSLLAIGAGLFYGIEHSVIQNSLSGYKPSAMRMNILTGKTGVRIIDDTYNANPQSVKAAIETVAGFKCSGRRIAVLGTMLELGEWAVEAHRKIGSIAALSGLDVLVLIGDNAKDTAFGALEAGFSKERINCFVSNGEAADYLRYTAEKEDIILIKGSRGMKMEEIVEVLMQ